MGASPIKKCNVTMGPPHKLDPCDSLADLVSDKYRGMGISYSQIVNLETHKPTRELWIIRSGKHAKKGMGLNFCPICGTDLRGLWMDMFKAKEPAA